MQQLDEAHDYYAVRVAPMREESVVNIIEGRGLADASFFMPRWVRASRYHKRLVLSDQPALTGYVFVGFSQEPNWYAIREATRAIVAVLGVDNTPKKVRYRHLLRFMAPHLFPDRRDSIEDIRRLTALADERERAARRDHVVKRIPSARSGFGFVENATKNHAIVQLGLLPEPKPERAQQLDGAKNAA